MQTTSKSHWLMGVWALILGASLSNCGFSQVQASEDSPPGDGGSPPGDGGSPPGDGGSPPGDGGSPPGGEGSPPGDGGPQVLGLFNFSVDPSPTGEVGKEYDVLLAAGETVTIGMCGISESTADGDTMLWVYSPDGGLVAFNNDGTASDCGTASKVDFTATVTGYHQVRVGCLGTSQCRGTVGMGRRKGLVPFELMNTDNATLNTYNKQFKFEAGDVVRVSTCARNAHGAFAEGNTYLRFYKQSAGLYSEVAASDDTEECGAAAEILYTVLSTGYYQVRAGCAANTSCHGAVAIYVE